MDTILDWFLESREAVAAAFGVTGGGALVLALRRWGARLLGPLMRLATFLKGVPAKLESLGAEIKAQRSECAGVQRENEDRLAMAANEIEDLRNMVSRLQGQIEVLMRALPLHSAIGPHALQPVPVRAVRRRPKPSSVRSADRSARAGRP